MMVLPTHITQMTRGHLSSLLQTWGNLPRVLWIITPFIFGVIHHPSPLVRGPFIMTSHYLHWQYDGVGHSHHSGDRGSPFVILTDLGKFVKVTVDYNAIY